jgi:hypothetical protein
MEKAPGIHWIGGRVGPRTGLDAMVKRKIPSVCRDSKPRGCILGKAIGYQNMSEMKMKLLRFMKCQIQTCTHTDTQITDVYFI